MTMDQLILKIMEQLPSTAAVIAVVIIFVKYNSKRDEIWIDLHKEHLEARKVSGMALMDNTKALAQNTQAFQQMCERLEGIEYFCPVAAKQGGLQVAKHSGRQHST